MGKELLIECPKCKRINKGSTSFFAKKFLTCECGNLIRVKDSRMVTKECPHCGNLIVFDGWKVDNPICPVCNEPLMKHDEKYKFVEVICPECSMHIVAKKDDEEVTCPICKTKIDVQKRLIEQKAIEEAQPIILKKTLADGICASMHPVTNFRYGSQIIVDESQTAVFLADGKAIGVFGSGRHTITNDNVVLNENNYNNGNVSFSSKLFYVTKEIFSNVKWGTDSKVRLFDPGSGLHVELGACGTFNYHISDPATFLFKLVGLGNLETTDFYNDDINSKVKPNIISLVKANLAKILREESISCLELDEHITDISNSMKEKINADISKYGIEIVDFIINNIITPDDDPNFARMKEQYAEQYLRVKQQKIDTNVLNAEHDKLVAQAGNEMDVELIKAKAEAEIAKIRAQAEAEAYQMKADAEAHEMQAKGYTYQDETHRKVAMGAVENGALESDGGFGGADGGIGLSGLAKDAVKADVMKKVGSAVGGEIVNSLLQGEATQQVESTQEESQGWTCPNCGNTNIMSKFCPECGTKKPSETWDCPECGTKDIKSKFCPNCGHKR